MLLQIMTVFRDFAIRSLQFIAICRIFQGAFSQNSKLEVTTIGLTGDDDVSYGQIFERERTIVIEKCNDECFMENGPGHAAICEANCNYLSQIIHSNKTFPLTSVQRSPIALIQDHVCGGNRSNKNLVSKSVVVILHDRDAVERGETLNFTTVLSYTLGYVGSPLISTHSRSAQFSNKILYPSFLRIAPSVSEQADIMVKLLVSLGYRKIILICSDDLDGAAVQSRIEALAENFGIEIEEQYTDLNFLNGFKTERESIESTVFVVHTDSKTSSDIIDKASDLNLFTKPYVWILSESTFVGAHRSTDSWKDKAPPVGVLAVRLKPPQDQTLNLRRAYQVFLRTMLRLSQAELLNLQYATRTSGGATCGNLAQEPQKELYEKLLNQSARLELGETGNPRVARYEIVNIGRFFEERIVVVVERDQNLWTRDLRMDAQIVWPGNYSEPKPNGTQLPMNLTIVTAIDDPIVVGGYHEYAGNCSAVPTGRTQEYEFESFFPCLDFRRNYDGPGIRACCGGFALAVVVNMSYSLHFVYTIHLIDHDYQSNKSFPRSEDAPHGLVAYLHDRRAHIAAGTLTLNTNYKEYIAISEPYDYHGMHILQKAINQRSPIKSFLQPFDWKLWLAIFLAVVVVAWLLFGLDKLSPFRSENSFYSDGDEGEPTMTLAGAMWFAWGVILDSGIGERTPHSFSSRFLGMVWCGFVMIMVASYTANLAAFLVLDKPQEILADLDDPRLRNPSANFTYATVAGSGISQYFRLRAELSTMFRAMDRFNVPSPEQGVAKVRNGELDAFIWESRSVEHIVAKDEDCVLTKSPIVFGRSSYVFGFRKDSLWLDPFNAAIMEMFEGEFMQDHLSYWTSHELKTCVVPHEPGGPVSLKLDIMKDLFVLLTGGIAVGSIAIILECLFSRPDPTPDPNRRLSEMLKPLTLTSNNNEPQEPKLYCSPDDGGFVSLKPGEPCTKFVKLMKDGSYV